MKFTSTMWGECTIEDGGEYRDGSLALRVMGTPDGYPEPIATLTVNVEQGKQNPGTYIVKTWSENKQIADDILKSGLFIDTGKRIRTGYVEAQVWKKK